MSHNLSLSSRQALSSATLYIVPTPIGNLEDITLRALRILKEADVIACEDTRHTKKLLFAHQISLEGRVLMAYHSHNSQEADKKVLSFLEQGKSVALVSDAGTPLISDPGYGIVSRVREAGGKVVPLPGPCSPITALSGAGLPTHAFYFGGFLPPTSGPRLKRLEKIAPLQDTTLVFLEAPHRLEALLEDMVQVFGAHRPCVLARELTKRFEEFRAHPLGTLLESLKAGEEIKGEMVLMIAPHTEQEGEREAAQENMEMMLKKALQSMPLKEAVAAVQQATGLPRKQIYTQALALKDS